MTHDCCLLPDWHWQGCVVLADSNHYTPKSFTCHWPSILAIVLSWNQPTELYITCPCHSLPTDFMMIGRYCDCEMSGDINRLLMFTLHCTGVAILSSQCAGDSDTCADPHLPSQTCEEQITNRVVSCPPATGPQTRHTGHCAMCWAGPGAAGRLRTFHNMLCSPALQ